MKKLSVLSTEMHTVNYFLARNDDSFVDHRLTVVSRKEKIKNAGVGKVNRTSD